MLVIVSFLSLIVKLNNLFCLNYVIFLNHLLQKYTKGKVKGHPHPRAHLLNLVRCLLGSCFVLLHATVLIHCCFVAIFVAIVQRSLKDPRKMLLAFCLLLTFSVCACVGRSVILQTPFCFYLLLATDPSPLSCKQLQNSCLYPPMPLKVLHLHCSWITCFFHRKDYSLSSLL